MGSNYKPLRGPVRREHPLVCAPRPSFYRPTLTANFAGPHTSCHEAEVTLLQPTIRHPNQRAQGPRELPHAQLPPRLHAQRR